MNKIKVVVFETSPKMGKTLSALLRSISYVDLLDNNVNNTEEALDLILEKRPDIIILSNDFPGKDSFYFTQVIRKEASPAQVIMISEIVSTEVVRQAMRSGACDFIGYKNLNADELSLALERAAQLVTEERASRGRGEQKNEPVLPVQVKSDDQGPTKIITIYSPKGGVGVSTITANLARVYAYNGLKVMVVDGDFLSGDMGVLLNLPSNYSIADLTRFKGNLELDIIKDVITPGTVDLLASPPSIEKSVDITGSICETILDALPELNYDILLVNTGPNTSDATLVFLEKADVVVLVCTPEIASVRSLRLFLDLLKTLSINSEKFEVVINRYEKNSILTLSRLNESLDVTISHTIPYDNKTVLLANNLGVPFVVDQKDLAISTSIVSLANFLMTRKNISELTGPAKVIAKIKKAVTKKRKPSTSK